MNHPQTIQLLDDALADQIAAGEVVERPASVVKELIENAIDARARRVTVEFAQGGLERIRVTDDGIGMSPADALLCIRRHATSKLRTRDDLFAIRTLGFRGEALPSIASVAHFELRTRTADAIVGTAVHVAGGSAPQCDETGCATGTSVEIRDLFYNVPARRKFLKSVATEAAQIGDVCLRAGLAHPEMHLVVLRDGRQVRELLPTGSWIERTTAAFPKETLIPLEGAYDGIVLRAALSAPERARTGAGGLHLFVNGRPVRDVALARALAYAYGSVLGPGRYPVGAVFIELDPEEVDVNVHPQKAEVRFAQVRRVLEATTRILAGPLGHARWPAPSLRNHPPTQAAVRPYPVETARTLEPAAFQERKPSPLTQPLQTPALPNEVPTTDQGFASLRVLGQARHTFIVCEGSDGLHILDQHAADERIRFNRLRSSLAAGKLRTQRLLFPERIELTEAEVLLVEEHASELLKLGLECSAVGPETIAVHTVPVLLIRAKPEQLVRDVLTEASRSGARAFSDALDTVIATMACHAAIRAGDVLTVEECQALLRALDEVDSHAGHCPHGRPVICHIDYAELERGVGR